MMMMMTNSALTGPTACVIYCTTDAITEYWPSDYDS